MRYCLFLFICCLAVPTWAQNKRFKKVALQDTLIVDSVSIYPEQFRLSTPNGQVVDSSYYSLDYGRSILTLSRKRIQQNYTPQPDSLLINYWVYPEWLTKSYSAIDPSVIVENTKNTGRLYALQENRSTNKKIPFSGLNTSGSISRGVSVGNNQNGTVNSELDLQLTGKLNDKVSIRASIQDANIPNQAGGYSQNLDEFDQIFIELYSKNWSVRAGDINLSNDWAYFNAFTKKIQGLSLGATLKQSDSSNTELFAAGALVRGVFANSQFTGQEGNQGPYKIIGPNGELFVLIVSGSETVFVNGVPLERGEGADYVMDYNAGEIRFNATYPITSEMRIQIDYQFTEQNYTRFIGYGGAKQTLNNNLKIGTYLYSENDAKNQELQQALTDAQKEVLTAAGDHPENAVVPSAIPSEFDQNRILYRKIISNGTEIFEFSTNPDDELFAVRFTQVGDNQGDYQISSINTLQRTYQYIAPINGVPQGNYAPITQLFAPSLIQVGGVNAAYNPSKNTQLNAELSASRNDNNLFSTLDDGDNTGFAAHIAAQHRLYGTDSTAQITAYTNWDYIHKNFNNVEGLYNVEFNRDWNLSPQLASSIGLIDGNQNLLTAGASYTLPQWGTLEYSYNNLDYNGVYSGNRHSLISTLQHTFKDKLVLDTLSRKQKHIKAQFNASTLTAKDIIATAQFNTLNTSVIYGHGQAWARVNYTTENNKRRIKLNDSLTPLSQRFAAYQATIGIGDSTAVYVEAGAKRRVNDSLRNNAIKKVNTSQTYFLRSQLLKSKNQSLSVFVNYRTLDFEDKTIAQESSLNSRIQYDQKLFNNALRSNTLYETNSGTQPQQEFSYLGVDAGQGTHTWNDYNGDNIQQLDEFEIAQFQDQANFIRILLPNQIFIKTHQNRLSQQLTLNLQQWQKTSGLKKVLSAFYNQTSYSIDRKILRETNSFTFNPFNNSSNELGLNLSFRNTLTFNRGKRRYTTAYSYIGATVKNLLSTGLQANKINTHQLKFTHKIRNSWLIDFNADAITNTSTFENFTNRNFKLNNYSFAPKITYLFGLRSRTNVTYKYSQKSNLIGNLEQLNQHTLSAAFTLAQGAKGSINGGINYIQNRFRESVNNTTQAFSPVAYQMLEGLQPGTNFTWNLVGQKRLTKYLDLNISYLGRKSETSRSIHTGNVQLRAFF